MESAKVIKARGEAHRALRELENTMHLLGHIVDVPDVLDLTAGCGYGLASGYTHAIA